MNGIGDITNTIFGINYVLGGILAFFSYMCSVLLGECLAGT